MEDQTIRFAMSMLAYAAQRDVSTSELCRLSGIDLRLLKAGGHPSITQKQLSDLWLNASRLTNDSLFGLHFGESLQLAALGIVGEIIKSSRTVGEAIVQGAALVHLLSPEFKMEVKQSRQTFTVSLSATYPVKNPSFSFLQMRDLLMVFVIHELDGLLLEKIKPDAVKISFTKDSASEYERVLRCQPVNTAKENSLYFPIRYWGEPILSSNYNLQRELLKKIQSGVTAPKAKATLHSRIKQHLVCNAYLGTFSLNDVAANFNLSPRSLQRKLIEEGVTFQQLADEVRQSLAKHYLQSGNYQVKEVSTMLGYNELSAFSRAFKRWTGKTPVEYR
jgi:AraC-like DNA-binding protein